MYILIKRINVLIEVIEIKSRGLYIQFLLTEIFIGLKQV